MDEMITVTDYERVVRVERTGTGLRCPTCPGSCPWNQGRDCYYCLRCARGWNVLPELASVQGKLIYSPGDLLAGIVIGEEGDCWKVALGGHYQLWPKMRCRVPKESK
jgi:hypothetical protein